MNERSRSWTKALACPSVRIGPRPATTSHDMAQKGKQAIHHQLRVRQPSEGGVTRSPNPRDVAPQTRPTLSVAPLGSRSGREPETSSTAKTPRRKQNRNTASSKSLFLSESKINTSQNQTVHWTATALSCPGRGGGDPSTRACWPPLPASRLTAVKPTPGANCKLLQLLQAADGAGRTTTTNQQQAIPLPPTTQAPRL
jgi:hypothetical protein